MLNAVMVSVAYSDFLGKEGLIHRFYALVEVTHYPTNWGVSVKMNSSIAKEHNAVRLPRRKGAEQRLLIRYKKLLICYKMVPIKICCAGTGYFQRLETGLV